MTATATTTPSPDHDDHSPDHDDRPARTAQAQRTPDDGPVVLGQIIELSPDQVAQHPDNIRDATRELAALTASVAEVGVLVPLIVVPAAQVPGHDWPQRITHVAVDGNRRQAAAAAAGVLLPCVVRADLATAKATARAMVVTGLVRDGLSTAEEAHAIAALFSFKYSGAAISRATGRSKAHVAAARKAATLTDEAAAHVSAYPLTLHQLAIMVDWQHHPDAMRHLAEAARRGRFEHAVAELAITAKEDAALAALAAELSTAVTVLDSEPHVYRPGSPARQLADLGTDTDHGWEPFTPDSHAGCPGHAVWLTADYYPADPDEDQPEQIDLTELWVCQDWRANGHQSHHWDDRSRTAAAPADQVDADERERREQEAAEARRAERRDLIRLNKEADAAETVRREFLHQCTTVKSRHKAMAGWALSQVVRRDPTYSLWAADNYQNKPTLAAILGADPAPYTAAAPAAAHGMILWTHVVAAHEESLPRDAHRQVDRSRAAYLEHLQTLGYVLSNVEQQIIDNTTTPTTTAATSAPTAEPPTNEQPAEPEAGDEPPATVPAGEQDQPVTAA